MPHSGHARPGPSSGSKHRIWVPNSPVALGSGRSTLAGWECTSGHTHTHAVGELPPLHPATLRNNQQRPRWPRTVDSAHMALCGIAVDREQPASFPLLVRPKIRTGVCQTRHYAETNVQKNRERPCGTQPDLELLKSIASQAMVWLHRGTLRGGTGALCRILRYNPPFQVVAFAANSPTDTSTTPSTGSLDQPTPLRSQMVVRCMAWNGPKTSQKRIGHSLIHRRPMNTSVRPMAACF